jgi:predicted Rossmann-fold nucleotide-binding protein
MGVVADACLAAGGRSGVIPGSLVDAEVAHGARRPADRRHDARAQGLMADLADGFVALPGFGTFDEFCEVVTWSQLGLHPGPSPAACSTWPASCALVDLFDTAPGRVHPAAAPRPGAGDR